jgi:hypothetical protein
MVSIRVKDLESDTLVENKEKKKKKKVGHGFHINQFIHVSK